MRNSAHAAPGTPSVAPWSTSNARRPPRFLPRLAPSAIQTSVSSWACEEARRRQVSRSTAGTGNRNSRACPLRQFSFVCAHTTSTGRRSTPPSTARRRTLEPRLKIARNAIHRVPTPWPLSRPALAADARVGARPLYDVSILSTSTQSPRYPEPDRPTALASYHSRRLVRAPEKLEEELDEGPPTAPRQAPAGTPATPVSFAETARSDGLD